MSVPSPSVSTAPSSLINSPAQPTTNNTTIEEYLSFDDEEDGQLGTELARMETENKALHQENRNLKLTLTKVEHQVEDLFRQYTSALEASQQQQQQQQQTETNSAYPEISDLLTLITRMWHKGPREMTRQVISAASIAKEGVLTRLRVEFAKRLEEIDAARMSR
ncbi:Chloride intracellular channel protein 4 [Perkinsus olseni]|uniref:Chloride intracellular channel protein 4 n=1 Tax=Perkinsus olseni TaxID=32597 RepID=A0A7J6LHN8_PEROL|nr:Chloride intracellular channel protein 4 [Perkinsus olseni]